MEDINLILKSTFNLYLKSAKASILSIKNHWKYLLFHFLLFVVTWLVSIIASFFPGLLGGFILGLFLALAASCYIATIKAAFNRENNSFEELFSSGMELFNPVISVFFCFFLIQLLTGSITNEALNLLISLLITVVLNPIPEIISLRPSMLNQMFTDCFEFISENILEWFLPLVTLFIVVFVFSPSLSKGIMYITMTTNPIDMIQLFIFKSNISNILYIAPLLIVSTVLFYFVFLFRLNLFSELFYTTRRKRTYNYKNK